MAPSAPLVPPPMLYLCYEHISSIVLINYTNRSSKGILKISGNKFLTMKFLCNYISEGVYYHFTKDLFATPEGKPVAAAGSCGHQKNTVKNWENISHLVRGQTRGF